MRILICCLCILFTQAVYAETFDQRVALARAIETTEEYKKYEKVMFDAIGNHLAYTMRSCFENIRNPDKSTFTAVVDIGLDGQGTNLDVEPKTNISICFLEGLGRSDFPAPPRIDGRDSLPIFIEMNITE